jgi:hypothetical protein
LFGLGWAEWLLIAGLVGGLVITFKVMARASVAYARAREMREAREREGVSAALDDDPTGDTGVASGKERR